MTNLLLIVITIVLNVSITLFILKAYTIGLTKELSKLNDDIWEGLNSNVDFTLEFKDDILKELNKIRNNQKKGI